MKLNTLLVPSSDDLLDPPAEIVYVQNCNAALRV